MSPCFATMFDGVESLLCSDDAMPCVMVKALEVATGLIDGWNGVGIDAGFTSGSQVSTFYDPMLAKVIGYGQTRAEACSRLARALRETVVHGVTTNRDLLIGILREPEFLAGAIDTAYLQRHDPAELMAGRTDAAAVGGVHALIAAIAAQAGRRVSTPILPGLPSGWRTLPSARQAIAFTVGDDRIDVTYRFDRGQPSATVGDWRPESLRLNRASPTMVDAEIDGVRRRYHVIRCGPDHFVDSALGSTALREVERFPDPSAIQEAGSLLAPMPGSVVRVEVAEGQQVTAGATVLVLEAMKMEHTVWAPADGIAASIGPGAFTGARISVAVAQGLAFGADLRVVPVTTLDKIAEALDIHRVDFIKMDIEGAEREALRGAAGTLSRDFPRLMLDSYHLPDDMQVLPVIIHKANPRYAMTCGPCEEGSFTPHVTYYH